MYYIGGLLGETFVVKQILPLLRNVILSCIDMSKMNKPEPQHSWNSFALVDSLSALEGLVLILPIKAVLKELLQVLHWQKQSLADKHNMGVKMDRIYIGFKVNQTGILILKFKLRSNSDDFKNKFKDYQIPIRLYLPLTN